MKIVQEIDELIEYWNSISLNAPEHRLHGAIFLVSDFLLKIPEWANWCMVQPSGKIILTEERPVLNQQEWVSNGRKVSDCGAVENGSYWRDSLEPIFVRAVPISAPDGIYHAIHQCKKSIPDDTQAITMETDGAVIAWRDIPAHMDGTWFGQNEELGHVVGWHANPSSHNHNICHYILSDNGRAFLSGALQ